MTSLTKQPNGLGTKKRGIYAKAKLQYTKYILQGII